MNFFEIDIDLQSEEHWVSSTDLMSGLMLVFLFVAISYMIHVSYERNKMKEIAIVWANTKEEIYRSLLKEFKEDLFRWNADVERDTLIVRFREPSILFLRGDVHLTNKFKTILKDFFPRYLKVLQNFSDSISEIRIEGHTSSEWGDITDKEIAYLKNMRLSQGRALEVLIFCMSITDDNTLKEWAKRLIVAIGMSSSRPIIRNGKEDKKASRRVEFRVITKAEENLNLILQEPF